MTAKNPDKAFEKALTEARRAGDIAAEHRLVTDNIARLNRLLPRVDHNGQPILEENS